MKKLEMIDFKKIIMSLLIFFLAVYGLSSCKGFISVKRQIVGSYSLGLDPFKNANFHIWGNNGIYCPIVFLENHVFFCDFGWGDYSISDGLILMQFDHNEVEAKIVNADKRVLDLDINDERYPLISRGPILLFRYRIQGTYCSYYEIDGEETIEFWRITSDQICLENSHGLRKCDDYDVLNGNSIMLDSDNEVMVFQIAKEHTFDFSGFVLYQKNQIDRFLMSCSARGIEDLVE